MATSVGRGVFTFACRGMSTLSKSIQAQIANKYKASKVPPSTYLVDILATNKEILGSEIKSHTDKMNKASEQLMIKRLNSAIN